MVKILFRVDSSVHIGSGHVVRCLTLANELRRNGAEITFVCRLLEGNLIGKIDAAGFVVHRLLELSSQPTTEGADYSAWLGVSQVQDAKDTIQALRGKHFDWIVIDHYALDRTWENTLRPFTQKVMVIDDLANRSHNCEILLDQNYFGEHGSEQRYISYVPQKTQLFLGPKYALLQPGYALLKKMLPRNGGPISRVLVFMGNTDEENRTLKVLKALSHPSLVHLTIDVVLGTNYNWSDKVQQLALERGRVVVHQNLPTLAALILRCDLVISAGGATTWERICLEKPAISVCIAENQYLFNLLLAEEQYQISVFDGQCETVDAWLEEISRLIANASLLEEMVARSRKLVDGYGAVRVAEALLNRYTITMRTVEVADRDLLLRWANESTVREQSFQQESITEQQHDIWFKEKLSDKKSFMYIAENSQSEPIGLVRFQLDEEKATAVVGISMDATMRGKGLGQIILSNAMKKLQEVEPEVVFIAEVRKTNTPSLKLFKKVGFKQMEPSGRPGVDCFIFRSKAQKVLANQM